jgi:tripartite-type tricarboxylate transporter receptor subunit TctC
MKHPMRLFADRLFCTLISVVCLWIGNASAQLGPYPDKPINLILPFPAGSNTDAIGRIFAQELSKILGQQVVIENKPGAQATIAATYITEIQPDGYTLLLTSYLSHAAAPWLMRDVSYDPVKDFTPIALAGNSPLILVTHPKLPVKSVEQLITYAKNKPGKLTYASGSSIGIVGGATFAAITGIEMTHVPYKGTLQAMTDVIGGQVDIMFADAATAMPQVKAGHLKAIAVSTAGQTALLPALPSMTQAGVKDFDLISWLGYFGPADLPPEVVTKVSEAIHQVVNDPETKKKLSALGFDAFSEMTPQDFSFFVEQQQGLWKKMTLAADIEPES